ncbi:lytic transglycosylase domain-containing protein [Clostridium sp. MT-14]|uniref:Lytic transglycosylase domain-containing protein n=1 Tax=Clostridium aromativorans TaxID=2836848 RepID=A0ABS8N833_9CLOT|nr:MULTISPECIES: lytic transglycosylase domain-containing protein [Clostridium]KAA8669109.1 lytic transglycosylase domain-containing protein [Clostridium sp. HV4-5-A1G]MCC9295950.1 lytic transglycosylase domain-containing protein [Clostridium aromativorans]
MKFISKIVVIMIVAMAVLNAKNIVRYYFPLRYSDYIVKYSKDYNLDPYFVMAVIKTESNFKADIRSSKNAIGLMQITPDTAKWAAEKMDIRSFREDMLNDPEFNIKMGCWYLKDLSTEFDGNMKLVLAAYNGGRGNVQKWLKDSQHSADGENLHYIPFKETDKYIKKVEVSYKVYKYLYGRADRSDFPRKFLQFWLTTM